jgi:amidase
VIKIVQQTYIARIEEINDILRPVTEINPDALIIAAALDKERSEGMVRGLVCKLGSL